MIQGIIEGFFGQEWSFQDRQKLMPFFKDIGLNLYIYGPKSDRILRTQWRQPWPEDYYQQLQDLSKSVRQAGLSFGMALSPIEIYQDLSESELLLLKAKVEAINELQVDVLCVCFDDMKGNLPNLAQVQIKLLHQIQSWSTAQQIVFCPTYYSFDPVLEQVFGERPHNYWAELHQQLEPSIGIFWTGPQVCSEHYSTTHLQEIQTLLGNRLWIWDNYPVNDGRKMVDHLHLLPPGDRSELPNHCQAQLINPMNQAFLSQIPLTSMALSRRSESLSLDESLKYLVHHQWMSEPLAEWLALHAEDFQLKGLKALEPHEVEKFKTKLSQFNSPHALEITRWLNNEYAFDPKCLT